ncbi:hypothetical protein O181_088514 [Austropuccinia psidii MF-1]|uniref:CCHC-type domain-containing protein n=1 Tax=Austropuccinia psidii MF-1 TaxID=1389203 RepID=A0A9Q3IRV8_9BASI|nr:hypothetical protein [Austropuccinia psidii MF-1]
MDQQSTSKLPPLPEDTVEGNSPSEPTLPRHIRPEDSPISPTPGPRAIYTPETNSRINNIPRRAFVYTPNNPSPLQQQMLKQERPVVKIEAKDYNLHFNGEEVEKFIKNVERISQIEGETDEDLAMQMAFWTTEPRISDAIEAMPGYEEGNCTQLKKNLIAKWGRAEPERRYKEYSLIQIFNDTQDEGGISTLSEYKKFIGEYETIITFLLRYKYIPQENMFHEDVFDCISADIKGAIRKEMIKDNFMARAEDGAYLIPPMRILKKYIEQELKEGILVTRRLSSPRTKTVNNESITKENNVTLKIQTKGNLPPASSRYVPYEPAQNAPKPFVRCYYCSEEGHSTGRCNELIEDQNNKLIIRQRFNYLYPNWERVPTDDKLSPKQLVREFHKEQEDLKKKLEGKAKEEEKKKKEKSTAFITMENWGEWKPPLISTGMEPLGYTYGLRNTKQRRENEEKSKDQSQPLPEREVTQPQEILKRKTSISGGIIDNEDQQEEKVIIPTRYKSPRPLEVNKESEVAIQESKTTKATYG